MSHFDKNMIYTAQDIEKYFSGKLTPLQMHQMEKAALDDPFLAEAMEGYGAMPGKEWEKQLAAASRQIAGSNAKVVAMHPSTSQWWKAAAAVLVIGCGTALTVLFTNNKTNQSATQEIAQADKTIQPPSSNSKETTGSSPITQQQQPITDGKEKGADNTTITSNEQVIKPGDNASVNRADGQARDSIKQGADHFTNAETKNAAAVTPTPAGVKSSAPQAGENMTAKNNAEAEKINDGLYEVSKRQEAQTVAKKEKVSNNYFNAQVVGSDNTPLPFSNISVQSGRFETYADVKGNFRLFSTDSLLTVEVKSAGYQSRTYALRSNQPINKIILLDNEQALKDKNENNGTVLRARTRRASVLGDSAINVEPKDGWENYNTYVANNLDIPEETLKSEFHGEVELSFDVKANGTISNIRINKSPGPAYDEAAKQLIMKGPQWKVKKGRKTSANVKVKF